MSTKFTPGPWVGDKLIPLRAVSCERAGFSIGFVNGHREAEGEANAHLIAAAPELYEALLDVSRQARHGDYDWPVELARAVDAALAKARGEA